MEKMYRRAILVDDDDIVNHLNKIVINRYLRPLTLEMICFEKPEAGLAFIKDSQPKNCLPTVLFLDLNMPVMNGWYFLEKMSEQPQACISHITVYVLSSSIDIQDMRRAKANPLVEGFLSKPLSDHLPTIFGYMKNGA